MILPRAVLGQGIAEADLIGRAIGADFAPTLLAPVRPSAPPSPAETGHRRVTEGDDCPSPLRSRAAHHGGFGHAGGSPGADSTHRPSGGRHAGSTSSTRPSPKKVAIGITRAPSTAKYNGPTIGAA